MKVLMISTDGRIFDENSEARRRMVEYGRLVEEIYIIIFTRRKSEARNPKSETNSKFQIPNSNIFLYPTNSRSKWFYIFDAVKLGYRIAKKRKDWLITTQDPFECGLAGYRIAKKFKLPLQLQIHTDFLSPYFVRYSILNRLRVMIAKFLIPRVNCIRVVSNRIKKSLAVASIQSSVVSILPIFVDVEKIKNAPVKIGLHKKYPQFDFLILMASRLTKEKNISLAIEALHNAKVAKLYANNAKVGLIIVGDGPEEKNLKSQISNLKIDDNIKIESWTDDLASYYKTADLFLLTSNYEGYGRTLVEAAAATCKIISSDVGIADEILEKENIFEPGDKKGLEEKIIKAIKDEIKPAKLVKIRTKEEYLSAYKKSWEQCGF